eukprot:816536-Prymnesium_polylepis.1
MCVKPCQPPAAWLPWCSNRIGPRLARPHIKAKGGCHGGAPGSLPSVHSITLRPLYAQPSAL